LSSAAVSGPVSVAVMRVLSYPEQVRGIYARIVAATLSDRRNPIHPYPSRSP